MPMATIQNVQILLNAFKSIDAVFAASADDIERELPTATRLVEALSKPDSTELIERDLEWLEQENNFLIPFTDPRYPSLLLQTDGAPASLYVTGDVEALALPQIAVVGSRNPTAGGTENAKAFASILARSGLTITSGLAKGIDAAAHGSAIASGGKTVAVTGTGLNRVYPSAHRELAHEIAGNGALVSEFPLDTPPRRENFPRRNRIIAALSVGTLVVEAAIKSGSLITARLAGEYGREVFAIPGSIHSALSKGSHRLIQQGAKLVETTDDILDELGPMVTAVRQLDQKGQTQTFVSSSEFDEMLEMIGFDPVDINQLIERTGLTADVISSMLLRMELDGVIETGPGGRYQRTIRVLATH